MKTNPNVRCITRAASVLALLALAACSAVPADPVKAGQTVRAASVPASPQSGANASVDRRALRRVFSVSYQPQGAVAVTSSAPPTVEQLPSGLFRVTFNLEAR